MAYLCRLRQDASALVALLSLESSECTSWVEEQDEFWAWIAVGVTGPVLSHVRSRVLESGLGERPATGALVFETTGLLSSSPV